MFTFIGWSTDVYSESQVKVRCLSWKGALSKNLKVSFVPWKTLSVLMKDLAVSSYHSP